MTCCVVVLGVDVTAAGGGLSLPVYGVQRGLAAVTSVVVTHHTSAAALATSPELVVAGRAGAELYR